MVRLSEQLNEALAQFRSQSARVTNTEQELHPAAPVAAHR
jgi:hypothetical protein